ncbi:MAG: hypothetical protein N4A71_11045 [Carboxylicivirga sp.]|jgi:hypothetical protein|nr:hypothetical protein [Carboxylicivirga sp.]
MKYVIEVDDTTKFGKALIDIAKAFTKKYKSICVKTEEELLLMMKEK